jgi:hypothetical protein
MTIGNARSTLLPPIQGGSLFPASTPNEVRTYAPFVVAKKHYIW